MRIKAYIKVEQQDGYNYTDVVSAETSDTIVIDGDEARSIRREVGRLMDDINDRVDRQLRARAKVAAAQEVGAE